jgi:hypothetical protein
MTDELTSFLNKIGFENHDPRNLKKNKVHLDIKLKKTIYKINESGWCWTLFCCSGHNSGPNKSSVPYIVFIVKNEYKSDILRLVSDCLPKNPNPSTKFPLITPIWLEYHEGYSDENLTTITMYWYGTLKSRERLSLVQDSLTKLGDRIFEAHNG